MYLCERFFDSNTSDYELLWCDSTWSCRWLSTFRRLYCLHLQSEIKMEVINFFKTLVTTYKMTWRPNPEDHSWLCMISYHQVQQAFTSQGNRDPCNIYDAENETISGLHFIPRNASTRPCKQFEFSEGILTVVTQVSVCAALIYEHWW